ncbi:helix-turn-helix domain-containing protein [Spirosoma foliorum]|uniref:Helix-turn-helix transcriptional regulator n=1 Tax=Spirosoma foliorum TaxID=2710596 RepID=A0A7G5GS64_9BACT|nr:helix-turn-helix transcriptional regulator [Spirosoma foliorum]QMW01706.1 helix-turn-helix transcriptional regulator [Spirosoma foliorum]
MDTPTIHQGRNIKRIREILGIKQDALATSLGLSQQAVSQLEQKDILDGDVLQKVSKALGIPEEAIKNFTEEAAINIVSTTFNSHDQSTSIAYRSSLTFNPIEKIIELYERMLTIEREKNELLQKLLNSKE